MDLVFDILSDLCDELPLIDYLYLLLINDTSAEIRYDTSGIIRRVQYYYCISSRTNTLVSVTVSRYGDLDALKWLYAFDKKIIKCGMPTASSFGHLEVVMWFFYNIGIRQDCWVALHLANHHKHDGISEFLRDALKNDK